MRHEPIEGFDCLKLKDELQARVQAELEGLSPEEERLRLTELVETGPLGELWRRMSAAAAAKRERGEG